MGARREMRDAERSDNEKIVLRRFAAWSCGYVKHCHGRARA